VSKLFQRRFRSPISDVVVAFRDSRFDTADHRSAQRIAPRTVVRQQQVESRMTITESFGLSFESA
jgi:hypothetical protein